MALEYRFDVDPTVIAPAVRAAAAAKQTRENIEGATTVTQRAAETALNAQLTREGRAQQAAIYGDQSDRARLQDELRLIAHQQDNARAMEIARMQQESQAEQEHQQTIRQGLKDGTFFYAPDQVSRLEKNTRSLEYIQTDPTIDDELREKMTQDLITENDQIRRTPQMRHKPQDPTPMEQFATRSVMMTPDGQLFPFGDPNVPEGAIPLTMGSKGAFTPLKNPNTIPPQTIAAQQSAAETRAYNIWKTRLAAQQRMADNLNITDNERAAAKKEYERLYADGPGGGSSGGPPQQSSGGPVQVRTIQEAMSLPPGTEFITPDGRKKIRP